METNEINRILRRNPITKKIYRGCFPSDKIPLFKKFPAAIVVNFDDSHERGSHWVAIYAVDPVQVYYLDSSATHGVEDIQLYIQYNFPVWSHFEIPLQKPGTSVCGQYAIFFIYMCARRYHPEDIHKILKKSGNPDKFVTRFVHRYIL